MSVRVHPIGLLSLFVLALAIPARGQDKAAISVQQPWARASILASRPAAAYLTILNKDDRAATLVALETPVAGRAEVHRTVKQGDVMKIVPAGPIEVPAGGSVGMEPGGYHVMLMDLERPIEKGETLKLTLRFANASPIAVFVPVLGPGARGPEDD